MDQYNLESYDDEVEASNKSEYYTYHPKSNTLLTFYDRGWYFLQHQRFSLL